MIIKRILNNNAVIATNSKEVDTLVLGKGISFGKKAGSAIDISKVEKSFLLQNKDNMNRFTELFINVPLDVVNVCEKIINMGKIKLGNHFDEIIYINLTDHIASAIKRQATGQFVPNLLKWEVSQYYADEYYIGQKAIEIIAKDLGVCLPADEATSIALHFINANLDSNLQETYDIISVISHIEEIVKDFFKTEFDSSSIDYYRFISHIKLFTYRFRDKQIYKEEDDEDLLEIMRQKYPKEFACSQLILDYITQKFVYKPSASEQLYLTAHIRRLTKNL